MISLLLKYLKPWLIPLLMIAYILGNAYVMTYKKFYFYPYNALPIILFIIYTAVFHLQQLPPLPDLLPAS